MEFNEQVIKDELKSEYTIIIEKFRKIAKLVVYQESVKPINAFLEVKIEIPIIINYRGKGKKVEFINQNRFNVHDLTDIEYVKKEVENLEKSAKEYLRYFIDSTLKTFQHVREIENFLKERNYELEVEVNFK